MPNGTQESLASRRHEVRCTVPAGFVQASAAEDVLV
jgi:hypothetical protein